MEGASPQSPLSRINHDTNTLLNYYDDQYDGEICGRRHINWYAITTRSIVAFALMHTFDSRTKYVFKISIERERERGFCRCIPT